MNMKKITSMTLLLTLVVLIVNSIILYVVPEGRVANWANWSFLGLTKGDWGAQHTTVGFLFLLAGILHIYYNWKPIVAYMKNKARQLKIFTGSFNIALVLTVICIVGTYYDIPPMSTIVEIAEQFKSSAAKTYGEPPYGHAESSSLKMFTKREELDLSKSIDLLRADGIEVTGEKDLLGDIAKRANKSPQQIYEIIKPATLMKETTPVSGEPSLLPDAPKSGLGKKTLAEICTEYNLETDKIIQALSARGIEAKADEQLKDIGSANDSTPMELYELLIEIVAEPAPK